MANERQGDRRTTDQSRAETRTESDPGGIARTPPAGIADGATACLLAVDDDGTVVYANAAVEPLLGYRPEEVVGMALETLLPPAHQPDQAHRPDQERRPDQEHQSDQERRPHTARVDATVPSWQNAAVVGQRRDGSTAPLLATTSELSDGEATKAVELRARTDARERLETTTRITEELRNVLRAAAGANSRAELEAEVCKHLANVEPYVHVWIGERNRGTDELVGRTEAGDRGQIVESVVQRASQDGPVRRAVESDEVVVVNDASGDDSLDDWIERAADHGVRSVAAVPLRYDGSTHGVLVVFADTPDAFDDRERAVLGEIGETVGLATSALERRRALIADSVLEVEFAITGDHPLLDITEGGPTLILEGVVSNNAEEYVFYHTVDGGDPEEVVERIVEGVDRTRRGRVIQDGDQPMVELVTENPTTSTVISEFGGTKVEQVVSDGVSRITADLPYGTDVRALHDALEEVAADIDGDVELLAQRTEDRTTLSSRQFKTHVTERLTDRQLATLRTAYFAGYHDRPRTSSGEDVAETLEISPSTFHQHHRVGVRKLLAAAFEHPGGHSEE